MVADRLPVANRILGVLKTLLTSYGFP